MDFLFNYLVHRNRTLGLVCGLKNHTFWENIKEITKFTEYKSILKTFFRCFKKVRKYARSQNYLFFLMSVAVSLLIHYNLKSFSISFLLFIKCFS